MMLPSQIANEFVHRDFKHPSTFPKPTLPLKSPCAFLQLPTKSRVPSAGLGCLHLHCPIRFTTQVTRFNDGNSPAKLRSYSGSRVFRRSKLQCLSQGLISPPKASVPVNRKKKIYREGLSSIIRSLDSIDDTQKSLALYSGKLSPKDKTVILKEQGSWDRVLRVFNWMKSQEDYVGNVIHYNVVLRALGRAQRWDEFRLCWIDMAKDGILPTCNTYSMIVDVYGKAGLAKEAVHWIKHMTGRGLFPDEVTVSTVVGVLKNAGAFDAADRFYKDWCAGKVELECLDLDNLGDAQCGSQSEAIGCLKGLLSDELSKMVSRRTSQRLTTESDGKGFVGRPQLTTTYNTLIDLYGKAGRLSDAADVFAEMLKSGVAPDVYTFNTMIHTCGIHGYLREAEALFYKMEERRIPPDIKTYNIFFSLYANSRNVDAAVQCFWKIKEVGLFPDVETYRAVLQFLCQRQMVQEAENVIREMKKSRVPIDEHSVPVVVAMYVNDGLLDQARKVIQMSKLGQRFSSRTHAAIIDVYAVKGLWAEAESVFFREKEFAGEKKDVLEYNVMIKAYGEAGLYDKAFSLFKGMINAGTWPDECTYNSLVQMFSGADLIDRAIELLTEMQDVGFIPRCATFSSAIESYVRLGRISDAVDIFQDMKRADVVPNEVVYGSLINGFAEAGRMDEALYYCRSMEDDGLAANQIILTSLIKGFSKKGDLNGAERIYEWLKELEGEPDKFALNSMINLYAKLGMVEDAKEMFNTMKGKGWADGLTRASMMYIYKTMGMLDEAVAVAEEIKQSLLLLPTEKLKELGSLDQLALNTAIDLYADLGNVSDAQAIFSIMKDKAWADGFTYACIICLYKKVGMLDEAAAVADEMKHSLCHPSDSLRGLENRLNKFALNSMIGIYADMGMSLNAELIFQKMKEKGWVDGLTYGSMMRLYKRVGKLNEPVTIAEEMKQFFGICSGRFDESEHGLDKIALNGMIKLYADLRMVSDAEVVFEAVKRKGWADGFTYASMMLLYKHLGMLEEALFIADEMKQSLIRGSWMDGLDRFALKGMMKLYTDLGMVTDAGVILNTMKVKGWADGFTYVRMIRVYKKVGMLHEAAAIADQMKQSLCNPCEHFQGLEGPLNKFALNSMIEVYADLGMSLNAEFVFHKMKEKGWADGFTYGSMMRLYKRTGKLDEAVAIAEEMKQLFGIHFGSLDVERGLNRIALNGMISLYTDLRMVSDAEVVFEAMKRKGWADGFSYTSMMLLYKCLGMLEKAVFIADEMKRSLSSGSKNLIDLEGGLDRFALKTMMNFYTDLGNFSDARLILTAMEVKGWADGYTYTRLLRLYRKVGMLDEAVSIADQMKQSLIDPSENLGGWDGRLNKFALNSMIEIYADLGMSLNAELIFHKMKEKGWIDGFTYGSMMRLYKRIGKLDEAVAIAEEMKQFLGINSGRFDEMEHGHDKIALNSMVRLYADLRMVSEAAVIFDAMKRKGWADGFTYASMMLLYKHLGRFEEAFFIAEEMKQSLSRGSKNVKELKGGLGRFALKSMMNLYADFGMVSDARVILNAMKVKGCVDGFIYARMIRLYKKVGMLDEAVAIADEMKQSLCKPSENLRGLEGPLNKFALNSMIEIYADLGMTLQAELIFHKMKEKGWTDGFTYGSMMRMYKRIGMLDEAVAIAEEMKQFFGIHSGSFDELETGLNKIALNGMISLYADLKRLSDAEVVFEAMKRKGWADGFTYASMMLLYKHLGMLEEAVLIAEEVKLSLTSGSKNLKQLEGVIDICALKSIMNFYTDLEMVSDARLILNAMKVKGWADGFTYGRMIHLCKKVGLLDEAASIADEMKQSLCNPSGNSRGLEGRLNKFALNSMIEIYADLRMSLDAEIVFQKMKEKGWTDGFTYGSMMRLYKKTGMLVEAVAIAEEMKQFFGIHPGRFDKLERGINKIALNGMISLYADLKRLSDAEVVFEAMKRKGWADGFTYASMMLLYKHSGMLEEAVFIAEEMKQSLSCGSKIFKGLEGGLDRFALKAMMDFYTELGMVSDARLILNAMEVKGWANGYAYARLLRLYKKVGMLDEATAMAEEMKQSLCNPSENLRGVEARLNKYALNSMIEIYADVGMSLNAKLVFHEMKGKGWADECTYASMIRLYKRMGMLDEAVFIAEEMLQSGLLTDGASFAKVISLYATKGKLSECGVLLGEMVTRRIMPGSGTFRALLTILQKQRDLAKEAVKQLEASYQLEKPYARQAIITCVFSALGMHVMAVESCVALTELEMGVDSSAYNVAIYAFGAAGKTDEALNCYMRMLDKGIEPDLVTYINLVRCYRKAYMVEGVKRVHSQLTYGLVEPSESIFTELIDAYKELKRHSLAKLVKQEMEIALDGNQDFEYGSQDESKGDAEDIWDVGQQHSDSEDEVEHDD